MKKINLFAAFLALLVMATVSVPAMAQKDRQKDKNNMRNLATGLGAVAGYELLKGKGTNAILLGAGAAYSAKKYEDARKAQSRESRISYRRDRNGNRYYVRDGRRHYVRRG